MWHDEGNKRLVESHKNLELSITIKIIINCLCININYGLLTFLCLILVNSFTTSGQSHRPIIKMHFDLIKIKISTRNQLCMKVIQIQN